MTTEIATTESVTTEALPQVNASTTSLVLDGGSMDAIMRMADIMAQGGSTIPAHFKRNPSDCAAVIMQSMQWRMNPYAVAQKTHVINGALGYEAQLVNAVIQTSGVTESRFNYEWFGQWEKIIGKTKIIDMPAKGDKKAYQFRVPDYKMQDEDGCGVRVSAVIKGEREPRVLELLLVQATVRNSPLWASDPKQQLAYLGVKRWARLFAPDVILGVYTPDELYEVSPSPARHMGSADVIEPPPEKLLEQARAAAAQGVETYQQFWKDTGAPNRKLLAGEHDGLKGAAMAVDASRTIENEPAKPAADTDVDPEFLAGLDGKTGAADYTPE